jgi:hypothetical protein
MTLWPPRPQEKTLKKINLHAMFINKTLGTPW